MPDLKGDVYDICHSNGSLTDSSQSSLQTVLVTFGIDNPFAKHIKRVRFTGNGLVEEKKRKVKRRDRTTLRLKTGKRMHAWMPDTQEKANDEIKAAGNCGNEVNFKGEASILDGFLWQPGDISL